MLALLLLYLFKNACMAFDFLRSQHAPRLRHRQAKLAPSPQHWYLPQKDSEASTWERSLEPDDVPAARVDIEQTPAASLPSPLIRTRDYLSMARFTPALHVA